ncbi:Sec-independent protein translocase protein TatB [Varunaivibrio sulfuroxidans]|uniref:Sec-independent protein translocase protein TatB n=1 Tax=Varunaivibrio sulfuroxidans TaxID=1773489 RepID=A0A4V2UNJ6_9PROT|nr:Sec-independent protein translocase protein TatB [Varunaivibrio sulfuroxidans]TCS61321.1 sec-independent protein translocase protein TatB [Varunaivibrio sulfuroxidans]WES31066.1 Sec-independent protein translocase protein TatB [Varunaivibrio sulfuroxidans]
MFDIGWQELFVIALLAIVVVGPSDLPKAIRTITLWIRKARGLAREFQSGVDEMIREAELDDLRRQITSARDTDVHKVISEHVDPTGELSKTLDLSDIDTPSTPAKIPEKTDDDASAPDNVAGEQSSPVATETPGLAPEPTPELAPELADDVMPDLPSGDAPGKVTRK